jgi:hypothetical protein
MYNTKKITVDRLHEVLDVCFETSTLTWKQRGLSWWDTRYAGKEAFTSSTNNYFVGSIDGIRLAKHRVLWAMYNGRWPEEVDHINRDTKDNSITNLREVTRCDNQRNLTKMRSNTSGRTGVSYHKRDKIWRAYIGTGEGTKFLGTFSTYEEAVVARELAETELGYSKHGDR